MKQQTYRGYPDAYEINVCETTQEAEDLLAELASTHEWVSVFWDRGWGDSPLEISIIVDGNGQNPKAVISKEIYHDLLDLGAIRTNSLQTFKARKLHDYCYEGK